MKARLFSIFPLFAFAASLPSTQAASLFWDGADTGANAQGGAGTWNLSLTNWDTALTAGTDTAWTDTTGTSDTATFPGTAGSTTSSAVALGTNLGALGITFSRGGYNISGSNTLTIGASGVTTAVPTTATITSTISTAVTLTGAQTWTANNSGAFSHTLAVSGLVSGANGILSVTKAGGGIINATNTTALTVASPITVTSNAGTMNISAPVSGEGLFNITKAGAGATNFLSTAGIAMTADRTLTVSAGNLGVSAAISGGFSLTKAGSGTLTLNGSNSFTGAVNITTGTVAIGVAQGTTTNSAIPAGAIVNVSSGAALAVNFQGSDAGTTNLTLSNFTLNLNGGTSLNFGGANLDYATLPGAVNLTGANTIAAPNVRNRLTLSGAVGGAGSLNFSASGAQSSHFLILSNGSNNYAGSTTITATNAGATIQLSGGANRLPVSTTLTLTAATLQSQLDLNGTNQTVAGLASTGTVANTSIVNSANTTTSIFTVNNSTAQTFAGNIGADARNLAGGTNPGINLALAKSGAGSLTLTGSTNAYTGGTSITGGSLILLGNTQNAGTGDITVNGGTFQLQNRVSATGLANAFNLTGGNAINVFNSVGFSLTGAVTLGGNTSIRTDPAFQAGNVTFTGAIGGTGDLAFYSENGNGTTASTRFVLSGASDYVGNTRITSGTNVTSGAGFAVQLTGGNDRLPTTTALVFGGDPLGGTGVATHNSNANLELNGISQTLAGIDVASGATGTYRIIGTNATASSLTINNTAASTFPGILGGAATNNNNFSFTKAGSGTFTVSGTNTYTGATSVTAGTLLVTGSLASGSAVSVSNSGSTLGGTGTVAGSVDINSGSILAPGATGAGKITTGALTLDDNSVFSWDLVASKDTDSAGLRGLDYDAVDTGGITASTGFFRVVLGSTPLTDMANQTSFWTTSQSWTDIFSGAFTGSFDTALQIVNSAGMDVSSTVNTYGAFSLSGDNLAWSPVPEPTNALAGLLLGAGLLRRKRK